MGKRKSYTVGGSWLVNNRTGDERFAAQELIPELLRGGEWRFKSGTDVSVIGPDGKPMVASGAEAGYMLSEGSHQLESSDHIYHRHRDAILEEKYGDSPVRAFFESAARGLSFGLSDAVIVGLGGSSEGLRERQARTSGWVTGIGEGAGVVGGALLTGGGSLVAKGGTAAVKAGTGAAASGAAKAAAPSTVAKWAGRTPAGFVHKTSMGIAQRAMPKSVAAGTATGLGGVAGRAAGWTTQGVIEGAAYGAGMGLSTEILSEDPFTGEAMWDQFKAGALYGGVFGGGLSVLGDTGKYLMRKGRDKVGTAQGGTSAEASVMAEKEAWITKEKEVLAARGKVSEAKAAQRSAISDKSKLERNVEANVKNRNKEIEKIRKEIDGIVTRQGEELANLSLARKKAHAKVERVKESLAKAERTREKKGSDIFITKAKQDLKEAKAEATKAERKMKAAEVASAANIKSLRSKMEELLTTSSTSGVSKFSEQALLLYKSAREHTSMGHRLLHREFRENWGMVPGLAAASRKLDDATDSFERFLVTWDGRDPGFERRLAISGRVQQVAGARKNLRVLNITDEQLNKMARKKLAGFDVFTKSVGDLEDAVMAYRVELKNAMDAAKDAYVPAVKPGRGVVTAGEIAEEADRLKKLDIEMPQDINELLDQQFSPYEYLRSVRNAVRIADGKDIITKVSQAEMLGDVSGDPIPGLSEMAEEVPVVGGVLGTGIGALLWYKGLTGLPRTLRGAAREVSGHASKVPAKTVAGKVEDARAVLGDREKQAAMQVLESQLAAYRAAGRSSARMETKLAEAMEEVAALERKAGFEGVAPAAAELESARLRLAAAQKSRDALANNREAIEAAEMRIVEMARARSIAEAELIAVRADKKFGRGVTPAERGEVHQALKSGVAQESYGDVGQKVYGGRFKEAMGNSIVAGIGRKMMGKFKGGGVGGIVGTSVIRTESKIRHGVGRFLEFPSRALALPASVSPMVLLEDMDFSFGGRKTVNDEEW